MLFEICWDTLMEKVIGCMGSKKEGGRGRRGGRREEGERGERG